MKTFFLSVIALLLLASCRIAWKKSLVHSGSMEDAIQNAIYDFLNTSSLSKRDSVFFIDFKEYDNDILGVCIIGTNEKAVVVRDRNMIITKALPTRYIEQSGKLFYWYDSTRTVTNKIISVLKKYNGIDTAILNSYNPVHNDNPKKGANYYFCKNNLLVYKKVETKYYLSKHPPQLNCNR